MGMIIISITNWISLGIVYLSWNGSDYYFVHHVFSRYGKLKFNLAFN